MTMAGFVEICHPNWRIYVINQMAADVWFYQRLYIKVFWKNVE